MPARKQREERRAAATLSVNGRCLPNDPEAERYVLSACLIDEGVTLGRCLEFGLAAREFYVDRHRMMFAHLARMRGAGLPIAIDVLASEITREGSLDKFGGYPGLAEIEKALPTTLQADFFMRRVREFHGLRERALAAAGLAESIYAGDDEAREEHAAKLRDLDTASGGPLPSIMPFSALVQAQPRPEPAQLVAGVIHRGSKVMLGGGSRSFKTWVLIDLGLSVATGTPWWGMRTEPGRVLFVNFELEVWQFEKRLRAIMEAKKIEAAAAFDTWHLRGHAADISDLMPHFLTRSTGGQYAMIILDPIYKCLGDRDENAAGDVGQLLNEVESLAVKTGAAVPFGHHFSKGNQSSKDSRDRVSGSGVWARDPDALITVTPHEETDCFSIEYVLRNFPQKPAQVVRWKHPCMEVAAGLDPSKLREPGRPREHSVDSLKDALAGGPLTYSELLKKVGGKGVSETTFKRLIKRAIEEKSVAKVGICYQWQTSSS